MNLMPCQDSHLPRQSLVGKTSWRIHHELFQGKDGSQNGWVGGSLLSPSQRGYQTKDAFEARTFLEGHIAKALGRFCFLYVFFFPRNFAAFFAAWPGHSGFVGIQKNDLGSWMVLKYFFGSRFLDAKKSGCF